MSYNEGYLNTAHCIQSPHTHTKSHTHKVTQQQTRTAACNTLLQTINANDNKKLKYRTNTTRHDIFGPWDFQKDTGSKSEDRVSLISLNSAEVEDLIRQNVIRIIRLDLRGQSLHSMLLRRHLSSFTIGSTSSLEDFIHNNL